MFYIKCINNNVIFERIIIVNYLKNLRGVVMCNEKFRVNFDD